MKGQKWNLVVASCCAVLLWVCSLGSPLLADESVLPAMTLEEVVSLRQVRSATINPAGDAVAYLLNVPRRVYQEADGPAWVELHLVSLQGESTAVLAGTVNVLDVAWSDRGDTLYFLAYPRPDARWPVIYRADERGRQVSSVFAGEFDAQALFLSPDGGTLAFLAPEPASPQAVQTSGELNRLGFKASAFEETDSLVRVWLLHLATGEVKMQTLPGSVSDFAWAPDGQHYAVALAPGSTAEDDEMRRNIVVVDAADAASHHTLGGAAGIGGKLGGFAWSPDSRQLAYIAGEDMHDPNPGRLYVAAVDGGPRREVLAGYPGQVEDLFWRNENQLAYIGSRGVLSEFATVPVGDGVTQTVQEHETPGPGPVFRAVNGHPGQPLAVAVADMPGHPREVYLLDGDTPPRRLTHSNPELEQRRLARQQVIRFPARDGLELEAILMHPLGADKAEPAAAPLIVVVHGGPEGHYSNGWMSSYEEPAQAMAAQGYRVVFPNYRGSTGRGVAFSKRGQHDYAGGEFNDLVDTKHYLVSRGLALADRTGITGLSYGGYAAMWAATALTEEFAAAVAFAGVSNQVSKFGTTDIPHEMYQVHSRAWPWEDWLWMLQRSPVYHAGQSHTPLLILAGDRDARFHPSQSLEMYRHMKLRTDTPVRLVIYPGEGHGNYHTAARYDYALRFERWMNHYLLGPGGAPPPFDIGHAERLQKHER